MALITITNPAQKYPVVNKIWIALLIATPGLLWLLPANYFDGGQSLCPSKAFFNFECLGCGMTRAVMHLHHFQLQDAIFYNYGVLLIYPALVIYWGMLLFKAIKRV